MWYSNYIKPMIDRVLAGMLLVALMPVFLVVWLALLITQGRPVFFIRQRSGKGMKPFSLYKFRTLKPSRSESLSMKNREFTPLGKMLRTSGVDELPQLLNVLRGEMSLIGPRPMPVAYNDRYYPWQLKRFEVKPGITGWAQVHGKNNISWERRFEKDAEYVDSMSFVFDLKICLKSMAQIVDGIVRREKYEQEMPVFEGLKSMSK